MPNVFYAIGHRQETYTNFRYENEAQYGKLPPYMFPNYDTSEGQDDLYFLLGDYKPIKFDLDVSEHHPLDFWCNFKVKQALNLDPNNDDNNYREFPFIYFKDQSGNTLYEIVQVTPDRFTLSGLVLNNISNGQQYPIITSDLSTATEIVIRFGHLDYQVYIDGVQTIIDNNFSVVNNVYKVEFVNAAQRFQIGLRHFALSRDKNVGYTFDTTYPESNSDFNSGWISDFAPDFEICSVIPFRQSNSPYAALTNKTQAFKFAQVSNKTNIEATQINLQMSYSSDIDKFDIIKYNYGLLKPIRQDLVFPEGLYQRKSFVTNEPIDLVSEANDYEIAIQHKEID